MDKLEKLAKEIESKKEKKRQNKVLDYLSLIIEKLSSKSTDEKLDKLIEKEVVKIEEKKIEFPKGFKVNNLDDIKFPKQKEIKIPEQKEFPAEVGIKEPKWFSLKGVIKEINEVKLTIIKQLNFDINLFKKKQNAIAVRLVTKDGDSFYNAGGGGSGGGSLDIGDITLNVDELEDAGNPKGAGSNGAVTLTVANTAYAIPAVAPTKKFTIVVYNGSDTNISVGFENSNANGIPLVTREKMAFDLGAGQRVYAYSTGAGKILTYTYKLIN